MRFERGEIGLVLAIASGIASSACGDERHSGGERSLVSLESPVHVRAGADPTTADGSQDRPFASVYAALAAITRDPDWQQGQLVVHEGRYELPRDSGAAGEGVVIPPHTELELRAGVTFAIGDGIAGVDEPTAPIAIHAQADVRALGTEHEPVLFTWLTPGKHWSAFTIFEPSAQNSVFEHAIFEHGYEGQFTSSELLDDGSRKTVGMRGALSLYKASARISHCTFRENEGDDGLNLRASHSIVEYSTFVDQFGDALDADQPGSVEIRYNFFGNNPNDAVDLGEGSEAYVHHNLIYKSGDKGISMGEKSSPRIENNLIVGCSVGIGNKDGSTPTVDGNTLFDNLSGIAAYEAVAGLGAGAGIFTNNIVWHTDQRAAEALELGAPLEDLDLQADSKALFGFSCIRDPSAADPERLGVGVISEGNGCNDPLFVNPTLDDWQAMNFHVRSAAGRWDAALKEFVTDDETSPTIDAGDPEADVGYESEPNGSRKNLGFDAGTEKASRSRE